MQLCWLAQLTQSQQDRQSGRKDPQQAETLWDQAETCSQSGSWGKKSNGKREELQGQLLFATLAQERPRSSFRGLPTD